MIAIVNNGVRAQSAANILTPSHNINPFSLARSYLMYNICVIAIRGDEGNVRGRTRKKLSEQMIAEESARFSTVIDRARFDSSKTSKLILLTETRRRPSSSISRSTRLVRRSQSGEKYVMLFTRASDEETAGRRTLAKRNARNVASAVLQRAYYDATTLVSLIACASG